MFTHEQGNRDFSKITSGWHEKVKTLVKLIKFEGKKSIRPSSDSNPDRRRSKHANHYTQEAWIATYLLKKGVVVGLSIAGFKPLKPYSSPLQQSGSERLLSMNPGSNPSWGWNFLILFSRFFEPQRDWILILSVSGPFESRKYWFGWENKKKKINSSEASTGFEPETLVE